MCLVLLKMTKNNDLTHFIYAVHLTLKADLTGVQGIAKVQKVDNFLAVGELKVTPGVYLSYNTDLNRFVAYMTARGKKVGFTVDGSWSVGDTFTPSEVALIISTKSTDCPGILGITEAASDI